MRRGLAALVLASQAGFSGATKAYTFDFGVIGTAVSPVVIVPPSGILVDRFTFSTPSGGQFSSFVSNVLPYVQFPTFAFPVFPATLSVLTPVPGVVGAYTSLPPVGQVLGFDGFSPSAIAPGAYVIEVNGFAGTGGGAYVVSVSINAAPIPEPETYALMLAGFGLVGAMVRRRARKP